MSGAIYEVGIHLSAVNGVSTVLAAISKQMLGLHGSVKELEHGFSRLNKAIIGTAAIGAGVGILKLGEHLEKAGEKLVHAETVLQAGLPKATSAINMQIARTAAYNEAASNLNSTLTGNVEHMHDLYNVVQDMGEAAKLLPVFNRLSNAFQMSTDEGAKSHGADSKNIMSAARAFELTGRTTPEAMDEVAKEYVRAVIGLRGRVNGNNLLQAVQAAGAGRYGWDTSFLTSALPSLVNVMGTRAGNGLYHMNNNLYGGVASSLAQAAGQEKYGLHTKDQEQRDPKTGRFLGFKVGSVWGAETLATDPQKWSNEFVEKLRGQGVKVDDMATMRKVVGEVARGNKLFQAVLDEYLLPASRNQLNKERANINAVDAGSVQEGEDKDPNMWRARVKAKWDDFEQAVGKGLVEPLIDNVLKPLTLALKDLSQYALKNPETIMFLAKGLGGLALALTAGGGVALLAALGPAGWLAAGIAGLGLVVAAHKDEIGEFIKSLEEWRLKTGAKIGEWVVDMGSRIITELSSLASRVGGVISEVFSSIGTMIMNALKNLGSFFKANVPYDTDRKGGPGVEHYGLPWKTAPTPQKQGALQPLNNHVKVAIGQHEFATFMTASLASHHEHPTSSPNFDGTRGFMSPDGQFATG